MANVEVYARAARVELFLNGESVGTRRFDDNCLFKFCIEYQPGTLEAVSYDEAGNEIGRCSLVSAGDDTQLTLDPEEPAVEAGHLCYVRLRYTDAQGITKPLERGIIDVAVEGGELLGLGSACPYYELSYLGTKTDTYYGESLAVIRAGDEGEVRMTASDGTYSAEVAVPVV